MRLAHHPDPLSRLRAPSLDAPLRVLVSGCLAGWRCGVDGTDYGLGTALDSLLGLPSVHALPFCPEDHGLGTPRNLPDIHGGDGRDVVAGRARIFDEFGNEVTEGMLRGARAMRDFAREQEAELAILTDMSAACGSQVISLGCRLVDDRRHQLGVGVATALLLEDGLPVVSQRDFRTLGLIRGLLDPGFRPDPDALDHHQSPWVRQHLDPE